MLKLWQSYWSKVPNFKNSRKTFPILACWSSNFPGVINSQIKFKMRNKSKIDRVLMEKTTFFGTSPHVSYFQPFLFRDWLILPIFHIEESRMPSLYLQIALLELENDNAKIVKNCQLSENSSCCKNTPNECKTWFRGWFRAQTSGQNGISHWENHRQGHLQ